MAPHDLKEQLTKHIDEALAMEQNVLRMLDGMIATTDDEEIASDLRQHKLQTEQHADRLRQRLEALGASPSRVREATGIMGAAYQLLERIAERAGDTETANMARQNRADEETFAKKIEANWDRFAELALKEEGVTA
jgi:ferritin-like metal-binding protein YciE